MDEQIVPRLTHHLRGMAAFVKKRGRDEHNMNPTAAAVPDWQAGWDAGAKAHADHQMATRRKVSPP